MYDCGDFVAILDLLIIIPFTSAEVHATNWVQQLQSIFKYVHWRPLEEEEEEKQLLRT